jgi:hypothetical protein
LAWCPGERRGSGAPGWAIDMKEWIFLLGFLSFFLLFTITSWDYPFVSALYPRILLASGFILGVLKVVFLLKRRPRGGEAKRDQPQEPFHRRRMWFYLGCGVLYIILMPLLGFIASSLITLLLLFALFGIHWKTTVAVAIGTSTVLYLIFAVALDIPLPKGFLENLFF